METCIIGWAHLPFGRREGENVENLIVQAAGQAIAHADLAVEEIDEIFLGHFNAGLSEQDFTSSLVLQTDQRLRFRSATRVENACATGSAAVHAAIRSIGSKRARCVLVVGAEHMSSNSAPAVAKTLLRASYLKEEVDQKAGFAGIFAQIASSYFQTYGDQSDALAMIAAKNHHNGVDNPYAHIRKDLGYEFCRFTSESNPLVADPLKRTDCAPVSDGAAALVMVSAEQARSRPRAIAFRGISHVQDFLPLSRRDILEFEGCALAWSRALAEARIALSNLSFVETHDCFTIAELLEYEAMGLAKKGRGADVIKDGLTHRTGRLPVNPSGGLKAKGHPIGATGVSMHVLAAMQLSGEAEGMQVPGASLGGVFNMGGTAVANYVSVLERVR